MNRTIIKISVILILLLNTQIICADVIQSHAIKINVSVEVENLNVQAGVLCSRDNIVMLPVKSNQAIVKIPLVKGAFSGIVSIKSDYIIDGRYPRVHSPISALPVCKLILYSEKKSWFVPDKSCLNEDVKDTFVPSVDITLDARRKGYSSYAISKTASSVNSIKMVGKDNISQCEEESTSLFISQANSECMSGMPGGCESGPDIKQAVSSVDKNAFRFGDVGTTYKLLGGNLYGLEKISFNVPREWLKPRDEQLLEDGNLVSSFNYHHKVNLFLINHRFIGLQLSSYDVQDEGAGSAAAGRDVFLVIDRNTSKVHKGLSLGITKARGMHAGCKSALFHAYEIADINKDGAIDIGVTIKEIACEEVYDEEEEIDRIISVDKSHAKQWYLFADNTWKVSDSHEDIDGGNAEVLPLIGLVKDPVTYVNERKKP